MDDSRKPTTDDDFKKLLVARPESSYLYIQYMAFLLQGGRVEDARKIAEEALEAISYRNTQDRLNVWLAWLNLENLYGNEATLNEVLGEAARANDPQKVHLEMAKIFHRSGKQERCLQHFEQVLLKKHARSPQVWLSYIDTLFSMEKVEEARAVFQRAIVGNTPRLPKPLHMNYILQFAQLEYKHPQGSAVQGAAVFDRVLATHPKRSDVWNVYLDQEMKAIREHEDGNPDGLEQSQRVEHCRQVFERATDLNLSDKRMKTLFKKYLRFEKAYGDDATRAHVLEKARQVAERKFGGDS